mmetsp:Transcript_3537/g.3475  ORF Transcript_3537/g.3475 Transcript_3537/m.3475 type:complete len:176 (+) Transcript_3537:399-926(+)
MEVEEPIEGEEGEVKPSAYPSKKKKVIKKIYAPEVVLLAPKMRLNSNTSTPNEAPCGGLEKQPVHYMTRNGSRNYVQWRVYHPSPNATCTMRLGSTDERLKVLYPRDGSADIYGSFPCAREVGYEGKEFTFPANEECDDCTLQFNMDIYGRGGIIHQCADIMIGWTIAQECSGKC